MTRKKELLEIIGNETRRKILELLSESPHYTLQISGKLNVTQPAILKHLTLLEQAGLVESFVKESKLGAPRKYYKICSSVNLEVVVGPREFRVGKLPSAITCPLYLQEEDKMRQLTEEINKAKDLSEKAGKAQDLINEADKLLSCEDFNEANWHCRSCRKNASLKKAASKIIILVNQSMAKGDLTPMLQALTSIINLS